MQQSFCRNCSSAAISHDFAVHEMCMHAGNITDKGGRAVNTVEHVSHKDDIIQAVNKSYSSMMAGEKKTRGVY